jgi:hypothetical protein
MKKKQRNKFYHQIKSEHGVLLLLFEFNNTFKKVDLCH